jgi:malate dehydrogenase (oxaloacetate-decarboxylating)
VSLVVAEAAGRQAMADGVADADDKAAFAKKLRAYVWEPVYQPYERIKDAS